MRTIQVPFALELRFESDTSVVLASAAWGSDGTLVHESENVAVVFGRSEAQRVRTGRWRARASAG